jgi:hypothetical protein
VTQAWVFEELSPSTFGNINVSIVDAASSGCWTNLGEVKTYAEDKLRNLGYVVVDSGNSSLGISVFSERSREGTCYGNIAIQIYKIVSNNGLTGFLEVGGRNHIFKGYDNANTIALGNVKIMIDEMRAKQTP